MLEQKNNIFSVLTCFTRLLFFRTVKTTRKVQVVSSRHCPVFEKIKKIVYSSLREMGAGCQLMVWARYSNRRYQILTENPTDHHYFVLDRTVDCWITFFSLLGFFFFLILCHIYISIYLVGLQALSNKCKKHWSLWKSIMTVFLSSN